MLVRLVRMTFHPERVDAFMEMFGEVNTKIRAQDGCSHLELWEDARYPNVLTTYSHWRDQAALDAYRETELFGATWKQTKAWFAASPQAHSHRVAMTVSP